MTILHSTSKLLIVLSILIQLAKCGKTDQDNVTDFAPHLIHQPHSVVVQANKPHTSECPVESQPDSEVKWFKDNRLLASEPMHLEQTGSELMFFQINDNDTGDYHCEASNYLGTVTSEQFRLAVQTSELDENILMEPRVYVASEHQDQPVQFRCTLPTQLIRTRRARWPEVVSWRKNGKRLQQVVWLGSASSSPSDNADDSEQDTSVAVDRKQRGRQANATPLYSGRQGDRPNEFILTIARVTRSLDDNSTYTCLYKPTDDEGNQSEALAHESAPAVLRVESANSALPGHQQPVKLNIPMGPPPLDIASDVPLEPGPSADSTSTNATSSSAPSLTNQTTQLQYDTSHSQQQPPPRQRVRTSLGETLADLYEIAKPTIMIFGVMCLVAVIVLLQFLFVRRRAQENRYMKQQHHHHHQYQYSSGSSSSANSSTGAASGATLGLGINTLTGGGASCRAADPILSGLLSRTLSGPSSASSLSVNASKKYKSYRDQMRKVAAAITSDQQLVRESADYIDAGAYFAQQQQRQHVNNSQQYQEPMLSQLFATGSVVPNLYDQSLAAREQARSLLQSDNLGAAEHMRSLGNLAASGSGQFKPNNFKYNVSIRNNNNSKPPRDSANLELPVNFSFGRSTAAAHGADGNDNMATSGGPLESGAASLLVSGALAWPASSSQFQSNQLTGSQITSASKHAQRQQQPTLSGGSGAVPASAADDNYQLVSCSSISPSSTSSIVAGASSNSSGNGSSAKIESQEQCDTNLSTALVGLDQRQQASAAGHQQVTAKTGPRESVSSSNHYSTIETFNGDEDECRYEELDEHRGGLSDESWLASASIRRRSASSHRQQRPTQQADSGTRNNGTNRNRSTFMATSSETNQLATANKAQSSLARSGPSAVISESASDQPGSQSQAPNQHRLCERVKQNTTSGNNHHELSPYAVSSICTNLTQRQHKQKLPPPVTSEAMQALNEQFDINKLWLLDTQSGGGESPTDAPPLPFSLPPPPPSSNTCQHVRQQSFERH